MPVDKKNSFYSEWHVFSKNEYKPKVGNNQKFLLQFDAALPTFPYSVVAGQSMRNFPFR
jgi:hypothetical protein